MEHKNAVELLEKTFEHEFDIDQYSNFIKELFNHFKLSIHDVPIWKEYHDYVDNVKSLGVYPDDDKRTIEVFAVNLKRTSSRDRARTMQRNLVARYLKKFNRDAALVAFYGDDPEDWRFSFVKMEYELTKDEKGNLKVSEELTPARRYSFLVGKNEPNHTCKIQFLGLIKKETVDPQLDQIEETFSIENVTKEFFNEYKELYLKLKESLEKFVKNDEDIAHEFEDKIIKTSDFAKKLMGQIVFIYFLQKKGWLGVEKGKKWGTGSKKFLRKLFDGEIVDYDNFFNDVLEPFFYEALATKFEDDYYSPFKCRIPFLNGGLFEPINDYDWKNTEIKLKNEIFKEIFDTFDRYNFTVKEDEPLEREVAVDPEMLGKVFENLLEIEDRRSKGAFYTPREIVHYMCQESLINYLDRNSDVSRKDVENFIHLGDVALGSIIKQQEEIKKYHQPYEKNVLSESIKNNHKELNKLLYEIKIVDPAVGSGAFPVGMMNEIIRARTILSLYSGENITNYKLKLETIENCLYGVDIDSSAVDIAKLRFWLSLIVDEEDVAVIDPLPNLDHKIMCGNSLLEEFDGKKLFDENLLVKIPEDYSKEIEEVQEVIDNLHRHLGEILTGKSQDEDSKNEIKKEIKKFQKRKKRLQKNSEDLSKQFTLDQDFNKRVRESRLKLKDLKYLQKEYFKEQNSELKKEYRDKIDKIEWELIEKTLKEEENEESLTKLNEYKKNKSKPFFLWKLYFAEIFQREEPGFDIIIANPPYIGEKENKEKFREIKYTEWGKKFYQSKMDIFYFFIHKALDLTRKFSSISFITTNYFITADGALKLRKDLKQRAIINKLLNFNELKIFEGARGQHNIISFISKGFDEDAFSLNITTSNTGEANTDMINKIIKGLDNKTNSYYVMQKHLYEGKEDYIRLEGNLDGNNNPFNQILNKIQKNGTLLKNLCYINSGADVTISKITQKHLNKFNGNFKKGDGVFVISETEMQEINPNTKEKKIIKDFIKNSDIKQFYVDNNKDKLIYLKWEDYIDIYPNLKYHLIKFKEILKDQADRYNENYPWYALHRPRDEEIFKSAEKILVPYRSKLNIFGYSKKPIYSSRDVFYIRPKKDDIQLKYLLAILNSKLYYLWLYFKGKRKGETLELYYTPLSHIPIKEISTDKQAKFIQLVDQIILLKKNNDDNKLITLKNLINELVYELYDITLDEQYLINEFIKNH